MNPLEKYLSEKTAGDAGRVAGAFETAGKAVRHVGGMAKSVKAEDLVEPAIVGGGVSALGFGAKKLLGKKKSDDDEDKKKTAGMMDMLGKAKTPAFNAGMGAVGMGAAGAGLAAVSFGAQKLYDAITKRTDFRLMLEHNPDLHEHLERDPKFFNQAYSSLRSVNMQFAKEPLIAGNYMRQMMDAPMSAGGKIELALQGAHQGGSGGPGDMALKGMFEGAKAGLGKQPPNPHAGLEQEVQGLKLQQQKMKLTGGPRPQLNQEHGRY